MKKALLLLPMLLAIFSLSVNAHITVFSEGFEDGVLPAGWTNIDADNDGNTWVHNSTTFVDGHESDGAFVSFSKLNNAALTPDNWLVTPAIPLAGNSTLTFWRMSSFSGEDGTESDFFPEASRRAREREGGAPGCPGERKMLQ